MIGCDRARRIVCVQTLLSGVLAALALPFGLASARDVLCGSVAAVIGSAVSAYFASGQYQAARPDAVVRRFYFGQMVRFSVIAGIFLGMMLAFSDLNPVASLAAFFIVQVLPLVTINLYDRKSSSAQRR